MENNSIARLVNLSNQREFQLSNRLTTLGSSKRCTVQIDDESVPLHCAYILFNQGNYYLHPVERSFIITCNSVTLYSPSQLPSSAIITIGTYSFLFEKGGNASVKSGFGPSFHKLVAAINAFFRNVSHEARFEMLYSISQTLNCDGARLVMEDLVTGTFSTIARYPQSSGLDRFSHRVLLWAKQQRQTILMSATDWLDDKKEQGSLELNNIGSILCMPIINENTIFGYLYLDRITSVQPFTKDDWEICNALAPICGDIIALYNRTITQQEIISQLQNNDTHGTQTVIHSCEKMKVCIEKTHNFAATDSTVLIYGETGTGKEVFARLLHVNSKRAPKPFLVINCGAIPEHLIESELYGHEKGAFTGAHTRRAGIFESADGGTVFLDEIGELPLNSQVKLLRVLQESEVLPVGSSTVIPVDVRILAATNRNLFLEVEEQRFRKDLYYRLNVLNIELPPLRERGQDIILLANFFIQKYSSRFGCPAKTLTIASQGQLLRYNWPGNIRELENVMQKAMLVAKGTMIETHDLELEKQTQMPESENLTPIVPLNVARERAERDAIINALSISSGNITVAANLLEIDRKWLTKLIKTYKIERPENN